MNFVARFGLGALLGCLVGTSFAAEALPVPVTLNWLGGAAPEVSTGVVWGVPWPAGTVQRDTSVRLSTATGASIDVQSRPLAFWPDGSVKWTGNSVVVPPGLSGPFQLTPLRVGSNERNPKVKMNYTDGADALTIDTGKLRARIGKTGANFIESLTIGERVVAQNGRLLLQVEDRSRLENENLVREENFTGRIEAVVLEQALAGYAVVKISGTHQSLTGHRDLLPFVVRLQFFAGSEMIKLTHTFVFDGDANRDFIKGVGLAFTVPFQEELQNRHLRFSTDNDGLWVQPVRMLPGYRPQTGAEVVGLYPGHLEGQRVPNLADLTPQARSALLTVPIWSDARLTQVGPNNWSIEKRTATPDSSWLHVTDGRRACGLALLGDVSGGLVVGVKDFWQKAPASFEITGGATRAGEVKIWLWSPAGEAMDLRRYDEIPHGLSVNYEDWKPGWGSADGIANTHDLTLWGFAAIPSDSQLGAMSRATAEPPVLVCTPQYYHAQRALGRWSLPDRSTPALSWVEDQVETFVNYYRDQVDERSWYGFWNFGDIMHNYDFGRHEWRYDVGGWAWANTELMPDMLLWYSFLRTGRADLFRMAEAMTRHTSEVDNYHLGPFFPLGSRHNVNHWGDGSKQPRESHAGLKRQLYFLSGGDGRLGDLLHDQLDADLTYEYVSRFNASHYVPNEDGTPRLDLGNGGSSASTTAEAARGDAATSQNRPAIDAAPATAALPASPLNGRVPAPRLEAFPARLTAQDRKPTTRFGLEWLCYALNWTTEWERGGDAAWRTRVESDMRTIAGTVDRDGKFPGRYFDVIFGGPENMNEMQPMYDVPEFWRAWANTSEFIGRQVGGSQMTGPRMLAYAAEAKDNGELGKLAWEKLIGPAGQLPPRAQPRRIVAPGLVRPVTDPAFLGAPVGWQQHGVASVQWALNAIETLEFAKRWLPAWEHPDSSGPVGTSSEPAVQPER